MLLVNVLQAAALTTRAHTCNPPKLLLRLLEALRVEIGGLEGCDRALLLYDTIGIEAQNLGFVLDRVLQAIGGMEAAEGRVQTLSSLMLDKRPAP